MHSNLEIISFLHAILALLGPYPCNEHKRIRSLRIRIRNTVQQCYFDKILVQPFAHIFCLTYMLEVQNFLTNNQNFLLKKLSKLVNSKQWAELSGIILNWFLYFFPFSNFESKGKPYMEKHKHLTKYSKMLAWRGKHWLIYKIQCLLGETCLFWIGTDPDPGHSPVRIRIKST